MKGLCDRLTVEQIRGLMKESASEEVKNRLEMMLKERTIGTIANERLCSRVIQVLQMLENPEATALLKQWATGESIGLLTYLAKEALGRLGGK
jgi:predicted transcriptional regulator